MLRSFPNNRKRNDRQQKHMALLRYRCTVSEFYTFERAAAPNRMFREESLVGVMSRFGLLDYELRVQGLVCLGLLQGGRLLKLAMKLQGQPVSSTAGKNTAQTCAQLLRGRVGYRVGFDALHAFPPRATRMGLEPTTYRDAVFAFPLRQVPRRTQRRTPQHPPTVGLDMTYA